MEKSKNILIEGR